MTEEEKNILFEYMRDDIKNDITEIKGAVKDIRDEQKEANKRFVPWTIYLWVTGAQLAIFGLFVKLL